MGVSGRLGFWVFIIQIICELPNFAEWLGGHAWRGVHTLRIDEGKKKKQKIIPRRVGRQEHAH